MVKGDRAFRDWISANQEMCEKVLELWEEIRKASPADSMTILLQLVRRFQGACQKHTAQKLTELRDELASAELNGAVERASAKQP